MAPSHGIELQALGRACRVVLLTSGPDPEESGLRTLSEAEESSVFINMQFGTVKGQPMVEIYIQIPLRQDLVRDDNLARLRFWYPVNADDDISDIITVVKLSDLNATEFLEVSRTLGIDPFDLIHYTKIELMPETLECVRGHTRASNQHGAKAAEMDIIRGTLSSRKRIVLLAKEGEICLSFQSFQEVLGAQRAEAKKNNGPKQVADTTAPGHLAKTSSTDVQGTVEQHKNATVTGADEDANSTLNGGANLNGGSNPLSRGRTQTASVSSEPRHENASEQSQEVVLPDGANDSAAPSEIITRPLSELSIHDAPSEANSSDDSYVHILTPVSSRDSSSKAGSSNTTSNPVD